jgi:hypothetical protein
MTPKELRKQVVDRIYEGKSYQTVFDELIALYPNRERDLAGIIADVPTLEQRKKYGVLHIVLIVAITVVLAFKILVALLVAHEYGLWSLILDVISPTFYVIFLVGIVGWKSMFYKAAAGLSAFILVFTLLFAPLGDITAIGFGYLGLLVGIIGLGYFLGSKIGGNYKLGTQQVKDAAGNVKRKHAVKWLN